ncbi:MAG: glycosyltransferase family 4 protein [Thermodesulfovibrionia bacterium]|nr:glycosyltransferase family 4 protein [Thermodesulfovibrionia bacterium]
MKIVVIGTRGFPEVQGGIESYCEHLYTHMAELGTDITVFTRKPYVNPEVTTYQGVSLVAVDCPKSKYFENIVHSIRSIFKARRLQPDIVHIYSSYIFAPLVKMLGIKVVINVMCQSYKHKKWGFFANLFLRINEALGVKFADSVIAISEPIKSALEEQYHKPVVFIPNGVYMPELSVTDEILPELGLSRQKYILSVGRFVEGKGFDDLIEAFIGADSKDWKLVIVGRADHESSYSRGLEEMAKENENIILTGFISRKHLQELYSYAGLFVLPSYDEGMPTVLLEAMSYGLSCLVTDISANKNLGLQGDRFFKAGDTNKLSERIVECINVPISQDEMKAQIKMVAERYSWSNIASETLKVYKKVLSER